MIVAAVASVTVIGAPAFAQFQSQQNQLLNPSAPSTTNQIQVAGSESGKQDSFVNVIKGAINWMLGILALIALIILLYGGFLMVTASGDEDKYNKGFTILKHAAIGLIMIGVARFVISIIFRLVNLTTTQATPAGTGG